MKTRKIQIGLVIIVLVATAVCITAFATTRYPTNQNGQTYGTLENIKSFDDAPELIKAEGVDGTIGYVKSSDVFTKMPESPEEAVKMQAERDSKGSYTIPLYAEDGKTIIGEFPVGSGTRYEGEPANAPTPGR